MHILGGQTFQKMHCPGCYILKKKNGHTHDGKQNYRCKECGRQFVVNSSHRIGPGKRARIRKALLERLLLRGICRVFDVSLSWLLGFMVEEYANDPDDLGPVLPIRQSNSGVDSARALWRKIPARLRKYCDFCTDDWEAYKQVIPEHLHYIAKEFTRHVESLFCTMRQRMSRLVRKNLAFSEKWSHHFMAIRYFLWKYNLKQRALHF